MPRKTHRTQKQKHSRPSKQGGFLSGIIESYIGGHKVDASNGAIRNENYGKKIPPY